MAVRLFMAGRVAAGRVGEEGQAFAASAACAARTLGRAATRSWNAASVAELEQWGDTTLTATGIGAYIAQVKSSGDFPRIALSVGMLCLYVILFHRLLWRRLHNLAAERLRLD